MANGDTEIYTAGAAAIGGALVAMIGYARQRRLDGAKADLARVDVAEAQARLAAFLTDELAASNKATQDCYKANLEVDQKLNAALQKVWELEMRLNAYEAASTIAATAAAKAVINAVSTAADTTITLDRIERKADEHQGRVP